MPAEPVVPGTATRPVVSSNADQSGDPDGGESVGGSGGAGDAAGSGDAGSRGGGEGADGAAEPDAGDGTAGGGEADQGEGAGDARDPDVERVHDDLVRVDVLAKRMIAVTRRLRAELRQAEQAASPETAAWIAYLTREAEKAARNVPDALRGLLTELYLNPAVDPDSAANRALWDSMTTVLAQANQLLRHYHETAERAAAVARGGTEAATAAREAAEEMAATARDLYQKVRALKSTVNDRSSTRARWTSRLKGILDADKDLGKAVDAMLRAASHGLPAAPPDMHHGTIQQPAGSDLAAVTMSVAAVITVVNWFRNRSTWRQHWADDEETP
jgi:hypothetical protein